MHAKIQYRFNKADNDVIDSIRIAYTHFKQQNDSDIFSIVIKENDAYEKETYRQIKSFTKKFPVKGLEKIYMGDIIFANI